MIDGIVGEAIALCGEVLGPFFIKDPALDPEVICAYEAIGLLDAQEAGRAWPFVSDSVAERCFRTMQAGLENGVPGHDVVKEFRRLFVGPNPMPAPPWGSVYTDKESVLFGESTLALRAWLRDIGLSMTVSDSAPEDHIGIMLGMLPWISENRPERLEEYLSCHVLTWAPHFLEKLEADTEHGFFKGLAALTKATLEGIERTCCLEVDVPRFYR